MPLWSNCMLSMIRRDRSRPYVDASRMVSISLDSSAINSSSGDWWTLWMSISESSIQTYWGSGYSLIAVSFNSCDHYVTLHLAGGEPLVRRVSLHIRAA